MELQRYYKQARERGNNATNATAIARRYVISTLADYRAKLATWESEPDKRRYAPGGITNRPKFPELYAPRDPEDYAPNGYRVFGFATDEHASAGLSAEPNFGFYAEEWGGTTYCPCVLIRRTQERHILACVAAYWDNNACDFIVDDTRVRDFARSDELFNTSEYGAGDPNVSRHDLCQGARDALQRAIRLAERDAEESREYSERWQEASRHDSEREDARQELKDARMSARSALRSTRELIAARVSCDAIEETRVILSAKLQRARADMRRAIATIERETAAIAELDMQGEF